MSDRLQKARENFSEFLFRCANLANPDPESTWTWQDELADQSHYALLMEYGWPDDARAVTFVDIDRALHSPLRTITRM